MFCIGEFSKIVQVPASLLRYYDDIGLFRPIHSDRDTGYPLLQRPTVSSTQPHSCPQRFGTFLTNLLSRVGKYLLCHPCPDTNQKWL
jgi:hypothetical protein